MHATAAASLCAEGEEGRGAETCTGTLTVDAGTGAAGGQEPGECSSNAASKAGALPDTQLGPAT
eukprot:1159103-Pelagomonas_calceolata.AAC.4